LLSQRGDGSGNTLIVIDFATRVEQQGDGQFRMSQRIVRVERQSLLELGVGAQSGTRFALRQQISASQFGVVGFGTARSGCLRRGAKVQLEMILELIDDRGRNLVLDRKHVIERPVIGVGPQMSVRTRFDKLRRDAYAVAGLSHRSFQHERHSQLLCHFGNGEVLALE
jgi:hypothetical protein